MTIKQWKVSYDSDKPLGRKTQLAVTGIMLAATIYCLIAFVMVFLNFALVDWLGVETLSPELKLGLDGIVSEPFWIWAAGLYASVACAHVVKKIWKNLRSI